MEAEFEGYTVTKLPPAYPDGSELAMRRWPTGYVAQDGRRASGNDGVGNTTKGPNKHFVQHDWAIGSDKHCDLLDLGGSLADETWGLSGNPYGDIVQAPIATTKSGKPKVGGYHQRTQGETTSSEMATDRIASKSRSQ